MKYYGNREQDYRDAKWRRLNRIEKAAPDLLSALEFLLADYIAIDGEKLTGSSVPANKAREALRKAKGEA